MILGVGCDLTQVERARKTFLSKKGRLEKVFSAEEIAEGSKRRDPASFYAARWAAREALAKALGTGFGAHCAYLDAVITNNSLGAPQLKIKGGALKAFKKMGGEKIHLSLSHEKEHALAVVILEGKNDAAFKKDSKNKSARS